MEQLDPHTTQALWGLQVLRYIAVAFLLVWMSWSLLPAITQWITLITRMNTGTCS